MLEIKQSAGVPGKRNQERIDINKINDDFVVDFKLNNFERQVIELIYWMRAVTTSQIVDITGYTYNYIAKHMLKLYLNRFVHREFPAKEKNQTGSNEAYYLLDQAGAIYIAGCLDISLKEVKWSRRDNLIRYDKLKHTLSVSSVRARLEIEARKKQQKLLDCISDRHLYINFTHEDKQITLRPDLYFVYEGDEHKYSYFVEVDLGTEAIRGISDKTTSFDNKVNSYDSLKYSGEYKDYFEVFPRILVITTTANRAKKLMEAVREKKQTNIDFLFTTFDFWQRDPLGTIFIKTDGSHTNMFE